MCKKKSHLCMYCVQCLQTHLQNKRLLFRIFRRVELEESELAATRADGIAWESIRKPRNWANIYLSKDCRNDKSTEERFSDSSLSMIMFDSVTCNEHRRALNYLFRLISHTESRYERHENIKIISLKLLTFFVSDAKNCSALRRLPKTASRHWQGSLLFVDEFMFAEV